MNSSHEQTRRYAILGPVEVLHGETLLNLGPRQRRVLLTRLLIEDGRPISLPQLCRDLWQGDQPAAAASSVRAHISRLRSVLDPVRQGRSTVLVNGPAGYALKVPREAQDTVLFERSLARARELLRSNQFASAHTELETALGLWRGDALGESAEYAFAAREAARLAAAHHDARELQATILIELGDLERAVGIAEDLVVKAPLREASWALLMRSLYKMGRSVEALHQYGRFRTMLAKNLGLDPSPGLNDLHTAILRHDTAVLGSPRHSRSATTLSPGPGVTAEPLVGRTAETAHLTAVLQTAAAGRTQWVVLSGEPGSGKTRLLDEMSDQAEAAGFTVTRAVGGQTLSESEEISVVCPATQLLDGLRQEDAGTPTKDGTGGGQLTALLRELNRQPTVCVIDDLDWATPDFHALLRRLSIVLRGARVAVVCALRNADVPMASGLLAELARHGATRLHLEPLSVADVAELLTAHGESASPDEASALHRRSEGNPFTLGELLKLRPDRRTGPSARVPASVRSVVQARLAELPAAAKTMLTYAAADGETLDIGLLADVQGMSRDRLLPLADAAVTARVLIWDAGPDEHSTGRYRFPELPREVVLSTLTPSSRHLLHAALARELARSGGADPARVARHLRAAGPMAEVAEPDRSRSPAQDHGR
ncbi:BTAD domain-containing putative transcriptional regulator [Streptomyces sp. NPDC059679]|uniref:BTAD domain-containing putative transcriptional regulator n=1 Tax=Streptomyces sp. NPDC059679 TaxID=3346903 RepID=UPI00368065D3